MAKALLSHTDPDYARWVEEIARYEEESRRWQERAKKIAIVSKRLKEVSDGRDRAEAFLTRIRALRDKPA